jgi:transcription antitermination factor NusG
MPLLNPEPSLFPEDLFKEDADPGQLKDRVWWVLHTKPRQEKSLARDLFRQKVRFYLPQITRRWRLRGRAMSSHVPLFPGYFFLFADARERVTALTTNRIVNAIPVHDQAQLWGDLRQVYRLISSGAPVTPEDKLAPGTLVEIKSGVLAGMRGKILATATGKRFIVQVDFIQRGASVLIDDYVLAAVEATP